MAKAVEEVVEATGGPGEEGAESDRCRGLPRRS